MTHEQAVQTLATERYLLDEMSAIDREAFESHFFSCAICADDLRVASAMAKGAKAGFAETGEHLRLAKVSPASPVKPAWYRSTVLPWASAAALALVTAYQMFSVIPSLRREAGASVSVPVTLRPASRGAEAVVPVAATGHVSLAIDINELAENGQVTYDLQSAEGREIASGSAAAPAVGTPLLLLVPASALAGSTRYTLSIHDAGASHRSLGEYRFTVSRR